VSRTPGGVNVKRSPRLSGRRMSAGFQQSWFDRLTFLRPSTPFFCFRVSFFSLFFCMVGVSVASISSSPSDPDVVSPSSSSLES